MPSSPDILEGLTAIANQWRSMAIAWHVVVGILVIGLLSGWCVSRRVIGVTIALSLVSVSALAWESGNPFNGVVFGFLALVLAALAVRLPSAPVRLSSPALVAFGGTLVFFGWVYPHFLHATSWSAYLYAAPLGLIPCPTLAVAIGLTLTVSMLGSRRWSMVLATAGILYGAVGVIRLGVVIDLALLAGAIGLAVLAMGKQEVIGAAGRMETRRAV